MNAMSFFKKLFRRARRQERIADYRNSWFNHFLGFSVVGAEHEYPDGAFPTGWKGRTPEEAMKLADEVVSWLYSDLNCD